MNKDILKKLKLRKKENNKIEKERKIQLDCFENNICHKCGRDLTPLGLKTLTSICLKSCPIHGIITIHTIIGEYYDKTGN